jgi:hypothetical protein
MYAYDLVPSNTVYTESLANIKASLMGNATQGYQMYLMGASNCAQTFLKPVRGTGEGGDW